MLKAKWVCYYHSPFVSSSGTACFCICRYSKVGWYRRKDWERGGKDWRGISLITMLKNISLGIMPVSSTDCRCLVRLQNFNVPTCKSSTFSTKPSRESTKNRATRRYWKNCYKSWSSRTRWILTMLNWGNWWGTTRCMSVTCRGWVGGSCWGRRLSGDLRMRDGRIWGGGIIWFEYCYFLWLKEGYF